MLTRFKPLLFLFLAQFCVGVNIVFSKGLANHINPFIIMTIRFTVASLFMSLLLIKSHEKKRWNFYLTRMFHHFRDKKAVKADRAKQAQNDDKGCMSTYSPRSNSSLTQKPSAFPALAVERNEIFGLNWLDWLVMLIKGVGAGLFFNWLMLTGLSLTNANSAGLITSLLPAIIVCLNVLLFKQKLTSQMFTAIMISVAGLILINLESFGKETHHALVGNLLVFIALLPEGLYYTLSKYYPVSKIPPITNAICLTLSNLPFLCLIIAFLPASTWHAITFYDMWVMILVGIAAGLFFFFWQTGVEKVDPAYAALATAFMPISTVFLAWFFLGEGLTVTKSIGMLFVILSILHYARQQETRS